MNSNRRNLIVPCYEYTYDGSFERPKLAMHYYGKVMEIVSKTKPIPMTIRDIPNARVMNRAIIDWSRNLGFAGMSGAGFLGFRLCATDEFPAEWLVLTIWGASFWLLLDEKRFDEWEKNEITDMFVNAVITGIEIEDSHSTIVLTGQTMHKVEFPADLSFLPVGLDGRKPEWNPQESQLDAWVLTQGELFC